MQFSLHHTFPDQPAFLSAWNSLLAGAYARVPFLRPEYLSAWWTTRGGGEWPASAELALVTAHRQDFLTGIAPFFFAPNLEGEPALLFLGSIEISDYLDLLVSPADMGDFVPGLLDFLASTSFAWKTIDLHNLLEHSPLLPVLQAEASRRGWDFSLQQTYHAPAIPLRADFENYLAGIDKKQRHEIRRKMRRAEELGGVDWYIVQDASTLEAETEAFFALMASDPAKAAFLTPAMRMQMHLTMQAAFQAGWLQLAFLTVNGRKAAGYLNFDYLDRIWVYNSGIDRGFMDYSPGWVLLAYLLRWACEQGRSEFDFMRGNEDYKYRFGGVDQFVVRARLTR